MRSTAAAMFVLASRCIGQRLCHFVDVVYDLARIGDACRHLESGRFFGKVGLNLL